MKTKLEVFNIIKDHLLSQEVRSEKWDDYEKKED